ncbi:tripartite tricarboxylate transporter substrate binding protein [Selenihalanaerobacter shriftii]|uniref:Tripartite-type tricarboxylate transporter, receptor component TctC n=1 Tax=Selenihalanaerobacter shriftii TaxID=142842 RepID=A0A1T4K1F4_9FIRM|nr:tripartite tricarboxylate transporter substrate binding protein [Selenihalanaerobacter shriftii]SJZ36302.1 Tripartite-type tricarboxylate transporter, receptor component TctC [Selenihalanaerobacter shriftii]
MKKRLISSILLTLLMVTLVSSPILAAYPTDKALNYIVCFNPGGESDLTARAQQKPLEKVLGTDVVVNYKIGGGGAVGWSELVNSNPDGYTVAGFNLPHIILQPLVRDNPGYQTEKIKPVYTFQSTPNILAVPKDSQFKTLDQLINYAKKAPGAVVIGGSGSYSANHLGTLEFNQAAGIKTTYIPFTGSGEAVPALIGGHVSALMTYTSMGKQYRDDMRILAVASEERVPALPNVPTFKELGYDYVEGAYRGMAVPPGTSEAKIKKLAAANRKLNNDPEFQKKLESMGFQLVNMGPEETEEFIEKRTKYYRQLLKEVGLL